MPRGRRRRAGPSGKPSVNCCTSLSTRSATRGASGIHRENAGREQRERDDAADRLRQVGGPGRAADAPAPLEDEELVEHALSIATISVMRERDPWTRDAIEETERRPQRDAERCAGEPRHPELECEPFVADRDRTGRAGTDQCTRRQQEQRHGQHRPHCASPRRLGSARLPPPAVRMSHERLHGDADAAEQQDEHDHEPVHRGRSRRSPAWRYAADEPGVGEVQDGLHGAVEHEWRRER